MGHDDDPGRPAGAFPAAHRWRGPAPARRRRPRGPAQGQEGAHGGAVRGGALEGPQAGRRGRDGQGGEGAGRHGAAVHEVGFRTYIKFPGKRY